MARLVPVLLYVLIATAAWIDFASRPPDGLANMGLVLLVLPYTALDSVLMSASTNSSSVLMGQGHGYLWDHAIFFCPGVALTGSLLYLVTFAAERLILGSDRNGKRGSID